MHKLDVISLLSTLVGISALAADSAFSAQIIHLFPGYGQTVLAYLGIVGIVASQILRVFGAPSGTTVITTAHLEAVETTPKPTLAIVPDPTKPA